MDHRSAALGLIRDEHRTLSALLHAMKHLVREIRAGRLAPDFRLLRAMVYYIDAFPERMHHPTEEAWLFAPLARCTQAADADLRILREEHESGARLIRDLGHALLCYEHESDAGFALFAATLESYVDFYAGHMEREEKVILPLAHDALRPDDWVALDHAFAGHRDPLRGDAQEPHFRALFSLIVNLAPPPIGVGPAAPRGQ